MMFKSDRIWNLVAHFVLVIFSFIILFPIIWTVRTSFVPEVFAYEIPPRWLFKPTLANYVGVLKENDLIRYLLNSLIVSGISTLISLPIASLAGYALAKYNTGGSALKFAIISSQMLPPIVLVIPLFMMFLSLKLVNTRTGLIVSYLAFNLPFLVWIMMGFFESVPKELEEAALIDGASRIKTFFSIIVPVATPGLLSAGILSFIMCWNEFLFALVLTGAKASTLPVALAALQTQRGVLIGKLSAGIVLGISPIILMGFFIQKYLVKGLSFGALK